MDVKWIKLNVDMFDNRKIKYIRKLPDGDKLVLIWVALLTMAGRCNAGGMVILTERIPYTAKMIADEYDFEATTVEMAIRAFENLDMISTDNGVIAITGWGEHQNVDGMERAKEQHRLRQKNYRERQKALTAKSDVIVTSPVTRSDATEEDIDKEKEEESIYTPVVDYLNEKAGTAFKASSKKTRSLIHARVAEGFTLDDFKKVIDTKVTEWKDDAKMAQFIRPETLFSPKFEGYLNQKPVTPKRKSTNGFDNYQGRDIDYDALLNQL